ncbi:MAG: hypothetical protein ACRDQD_16590 [Nocardioidaceae bacterium]
MPTLAKRKLIEPDYWTCPHGVRVRPEPALTYGPEVADLCDKVGYAPDAQQELGLDLVFAIRPDGSPLAFSGCIICARQNLKSGLFQQCVLGWLFVVEIDEIAWSAHELRTSLNAQTELYRTIESSFLSKYLPANGRPNPGLYETNGKERIELNTGQTTWFQTRTRDGGRGLGKPKVIIDEAFKFKKRTAGALLPIMLAQHHPQLLYGSSEPPIDEDSEHLRDVIDRGQKHKSPSMWFLQWRAKREECADPDCTHPKDALARGLDCALDRTHLLLQANPTVHRDDDGNPLDTGRITIETLRNLRQELDPAEFMRECLGWKDEDDEAGPPAINGRRWSLSAEKGGLLMPGAAPPVKACAVLYTQPDRSVTSIGVAGVNVDDELVLLEYTAPGEAWVPDRLATLRENVDVLEVALHPSSEAKTLVPALKADGIRFTAKADSEELGRNLVLSDLAAGCSSLLNKVENGGVVHRGQTSLDAAAAVARTKTTGHGQTTWDVGSSAVPLAPLVAVSTALYRWELRAAEPEAPAPSPVSTSGGGERVSSGGFDALSADF